jgi:hypothetical protein
MCYGPWGQEATERVPDLLKYADAFIANDDVAHPVLFIRSDST